jgi:DNA-directed RNA polymerase specialized sigma24 family protein
MSAGGSVTHWIEQIREGDPVAAQAVWERYFPELVRLAGEKLRDVPRRAADEEDVASSVMESLFRAARQGRFPNLADRHELWRLLLCYTNEEMAERFDCSVRTIERRLRLIRRKWQQDEPP